MKSLRGWLLAMAHAALVEVTERLAPSGPLLPDAEVQAPRTEMRQTLFDRIAERMAEDLTDDAIAAHLDAWENAQQ